MMNNRLLLKGYLLGYERRILPRWIRKLFARSELHKAWLSGYHGRFEENGVCYGPNNPYN